jgi:hypothetical protein
MRAPRSLLLLLLLLLLIAVGCGSAEILAPAPLLIVDTSPGNGSVIAPGDHPIALLFSEDVVQSLVEDSVRLEETTEQGTPLRELAISLERYDGETFTAVLRTESMPPATIYALTVSAETLRATSGARMAADFVRRFRTSE